MERKQQQHDDLQKSFNDYLESSKELENELETALEEAVEKIDKISEREAAAEKKELQNRVDELTRDNTKLLVQAKTTNGKSTGSEELTLKIRKLENENESLSNQVRILQATKEDLQHKVQSLEEDVVFLKTDVEAATLSRDELEAEMKG